MATSPSEAFNTAFRDFNTPGVPSSGPYNPKKSEVRAIGPSIEQYLSSAAAGVLVSAAADVRPLALANDRLIIDDNLVIGEIDDTLGYFDAVFRGEGTLKGLYRKWVIPWDAPGMDIRCSDVRPSQMPKLNSATSPVVVLAGDSVASNRANQWGSMDMLTDTLSRELRQQAGGQKSISFINRSVGGQTYSNFNSTPSGLATWPQWYTDTGKAWLEYIKDLSPDVVVIAFGMNSDAATMGQMAAIRAKIKAWTKVPDIVWCTNLNPSPNAYTAEWHNIADQAIRDRDASATRSLAKFWGDPILDFHRAHCMARDGFDPTSGVFENLGNIPKGVANAFVVPEKHNGSFRATITFAPFTSGIIVFRTGEKADDVFYLQASGSANQYTLLGYAGSPGDHPFGAGITYVSQNLTLSPVGGLVTLEWAQLGNFATLRNMTGALNYGEFTGPIWQGLIVANQGYYQGKIEQSAGLDVISSCQMGIVRPRLNVPSCSNSRLWGNPTGGAQVGPFGGSGYNHPSDYIAPYVYEPVIRQARFFS